MRRFYICMFLCFFLESGVFAKKLPPNAAITSFNALQLIQSKLIRLPRSMPDPFNQVLSKMSISGYDAAQFAFQPPRKNQHRVKVSTFSAEYVENQDVLMPNRSERPTDISKNEWQAVNAFFKSLNFNELAAENRHYQFTFVDLDDDGLRDLVMSYYVGGTGLFTQFEVYKRYLKDGFKPAEMNKEVAFAPWQAISGRPVYQKFFFISVRGNTYVAYIEHDYSTQVLTLYRPFSRKMPNKQLLIEYAHEYEVAREWGFESPDATQNQQESAKTFERWAKQHEPLLDTINHRLALLPKEKIRADKSNVAACTYLSNKDVENNDSALEEKPNDQPESWGMALHYTMLKGDAFWIRTKQACFYAEIVCLGSASNCELNLYQQPGELYQSLGLIRKKTYRTNLRLIDFSLSLTP